MSMRTQVSTRSGTGFFHTLGIPLLAGREFTAADGAGSSKVAIVNEAFAKRVPPRAQRGGQAHVDGWQDLDMEIVGLVKDSKYSAVKQEIPPVFVIPHAQDTTIGSMNFYLRTTLEPVELMRTVTAVVSRLDPTLPLANLKPLPQQVKENVFPRPPHHHVCPPRLRSWRRCWPRWDCTACWPIPSPAHP
jgi:hypothetical protein